MIGWWRRSREARPVSTHDMKWLLRFFGPGFDSQQVHHSPYTAEQDGIPMWVVVGLSWFRLGFGWVMDRAGTGAHRNESRIKTANTLDSKQKSNVLIFPVRTAVPMQMAA